MSLKHVQPGECASLLLGKSLTASQTSTLVKTAELEVIRLVLPAGKEIPIHQVAGPITVQCLEGRVTFTAHEKQQDLAGGDFLYLEGSAPHALQALSDAAVLVTIVLKPKVVAPPLDVVDEASEESFPASDPPAY